MVKTKRQHADDDSRPEDCATAWFAVLERARLDQNYDLAAKAQRELDRLGVKVRFTRTGESEARDAR